MAGYPVGAGLGQAGGAPVRIANITLSLRPATEEEPRPVELWRALGGTNLSRYTSAELVEDSETMPRPLLAIIAAVTSNGTIGKDGGMPWHIPMDLAYFRGVTKGHSVIMGRRTWESLGKALPHRRNIIVTSNSEVTYPGAETVSSLDDALKLCADDKLVFCIGGAQLYEKALPYADFLYLTEIRQKIQGDTQFPDVDWMAWRTECRTPCTQLAEPVNFDFVLYARKQP